MLQLDPFKKFHNVLFGLDGRWRNLESRKLVDLGDFLRKLVSSRPLEHSESKRSVATYV